MFNRWKICECCGQDKSNVEPYRIDSREDCVMLCDECYDGCTTNNDIIVFIPYPGIYKRENI